MSTNQNTWSGSDICQECAGSSAPEPELRLVSLGINTLERVEVFEDKLVKRHLARATRFVESGLARRTDGFHEVVDCIGRAAT